MRTWILKEGQEPPGDLRSSRFWDVVLNGSRGDPEGQCESVSGKPSGFTCQGF